MSTLGTDLDMKTLKDLCHDAGYEPRSYSGRGMYGKKCFAVESDAGNPVNVVLDILDQAVEFGDVKRNGDTLELLQSLISELRSPSVDNMGMGYIVYWQNIPWEESEGSSEDEEE